MIGYKAASLRIYTDFEESTLATFRPATFFIPISNSKSEFRFGNVFTCSFIMNDEQQKKGFQIFELASLLCRPL